MPANAKASLVGAGPGDPGLITVKGLEALRSADVIIYDRLAPPELLQQARSDARLINASKAPGATQMGQDEINATMISEARAGNSVCRLKGGDPFVFGRGGEESVALRRAGIWFEVIPGVSSAIAAPASSGIPVTHRGVSRSCTIATGSTESGEVDEEYWRQMAQVEGTLVVLMGAGNIAKITDALVKYGRPHDQPAAGTYAGTRSDQTTITGTVSTIAKLTAQRGLDAPIVFTFGDVVSLAPEIDWITQLPLHGKRAVVSRARSSNSRLAAGLRELGATVFETPAIRIEPLESFAELDGVLADVAQYDWISFASANAVHQVFGRLLENGRDARMLAAVRVAAIGPATVDALAQHGIVADLVPVYYSSQGLIDAFNVLPESPKRVLAFKSDIGRESVMQGLSQMGATVHAVPAYRTVRADESAAIAKSAYVQGVDITTFTSSSTVTNLLGMLDGDPEPINRGVVTCIGPITAGTARELGIRVDIVPPVHTIDSMIDALLGRFSRT